ncbi:MAG: hypothetical protein PHR33_01065 [Bacilli bacterium]|nr:hypothetical protein [Bacilli bacterium]
MASTIDIARKFTDIEYLSKKEIANRMGEQLADSIWRQVSEYREKYRFPLEIKKFDRIPFSVVLTPSIMGIANSTERLMFKFSNLFEKLKLLQSISDHKPIDNFIDEVLKEDLLIFASQEEIQVSDKDIEVMMDVTSPHLKDTHVYGIYKTTKYLLENPSLKIDKQIFRDMISRLSSIDIQDNNFVYRNFDLKVPNTTTFEGAQCERIPEFMSSFFEFYDSDFEMSPFIIAAIMYFYLLYVSPFEKYNEEVALFIYQKVLADSGYGESSYYLSLSEFILQRKDDFALIFDEIKRSGDVTYGILFLCQLVFDSISWRLKNLQKIEEPKPIYSEVGVVEKIVEKVVEKEVPVYIEKIVEVAKETPKQAIEENEKENDNLENTTEYFKQFNESSNDKKEKKQFDFIDDPFLKYVDKNKEETDKIEELTGDDKRIDKIENINDMQEPQKYEENKKVFENIEKLDEKVEEDNLEKINIKKENIEEINNKKNITKMDTDLEIDVSQLDGLTEEEYAKHLVEMNPLIKYHQAFFFATHRVEGRYYTISQFKQFVDCAYETARTSMDFLVTVGLYRKEQLKNKFVYTPNIVRKEG